MNLQGGANRPNSQDCFSRRRDLKELLRSGNDDSGYIEGKVFMIWPPRNRTHRINLEVVEGSVLYRFEVEVPHKDGIAFRPHERISLALKGMRVDQRKESSAPYYFPIVLRFPDGVVLKYLSGVNAGKVVDTWEGNTDEWYNPGVVHSVSDAVAIDASEVHHSPVPMITEPPILAPKRDVTGCQHEDVKTDHPPPSSIAVADDAATAQSAQQPSTERPGRVSKVKQRRKRRLHKEKKMTFHHQPVNGTDRSLPADVAMPCHEQPHTSAQSSFGDVPDRRPNLDQRTNKDSYIPEGSGIDFSRESSHSNMLTVPTLQMKAGVRTQRGDIFTALSDLQKGHSMVNIIGIVTLVNPEKRTSTNEWSRSFALTDPSIIDLPRQNITVNCFQKKHLEWLPQVQRGDIVILRKLKIVEFGGALAATGYGDKLRWAVYEPLGHSIRPPNKGDAPEKESIDDGMGYEFSPYWKPCQDSTELEYCRQIGEWWKAKHEVEGQNLPVVECSAARRQHLLISDASPDRPPNGFFDCTVEVLQKSNNHGGATAVHVTDYTPNPLVHPVQAAWCPPELRDRVLQCDMWDNARNIAKMMNPGEYWYLHNVRARWNPSHYMEGTMQLAEKVTQLDETKLESQPHLRALLVRKKEFELDKSGHTSGSASLNIFPQLLLQDVERSTSFLTCIIELLHNDLDSRDGHFIYVTDYTYNPDLPTTASAADWAHNLEHRVLKIKLDDSQAKISLDLNSGSMYIIQNLRIKRSNASGMYGCLGGEDTHFLSLNDLSSSHAQALRRNKEKWKRENMLNGLPTSPNGSHEEALGLLRQSSSLLNNTNLQKMLPKPAPDMFRVLARAMDFFPFSLEDACVLRCTKCGSSPPPSFKRCPRCDDMIETHCKWVYHLYILVQDEEGSELIVSLSGKECTLLQDVNPIDFRCDRVVFRRFLTKLDPILGNLRDVHMAWSRNEHKVVESPLMAFIIESWNVGDEKGYSLLDCIPIKTTGV